MRSLSLVAASGEGGSYTQHFQLLEGPATVGGLGSVEYVLTITIGTETSYSGRVDLGRGCRVALQIPASGDRLMVRYLE